jgi:hypothetical protein
MNLFFIASDDSTKFSTSIRQVSTDGIERILLSPNLIFKLVIFEVIEAGDKGLRLLIERHSRGFHDEFRRRSIIEKSVQVERNRTFPLLWLLLLLLLLFLHSFRE